MGKTSSGLTIFLRKRAFGQYVDIYNETERVVVAKVEAHTMGWVQNMFELAEEAAIGPDEDE